MIEADKKALQQLLSLAAGHRTEIMRGSAALLGTRRDEYQAMPFDEHEPQVAPFWLWCLRTKPQWHPTPIQAALQYLLHWREWTSTIRTR